MAHVNVYAVHVKIIYVMQCNAGCIELNLYTLAAVNVCSLLHHFYSQYILCMLEHAAQPLALEYTYVSMNSPAETGTHSMIYTDTTRSDKIVQFQRSPLVTMKPNLNMRNSGVYEAKVAKWSWLNIGFVGNWTFHSDKKKESSLTSMKLSSSVHLI